MDFKQQKKSNPPLKLKGVYEGYTEISTLKADFIAPLQNYVFFLKSFSLLSMSL
jgi:hypothetical protein